MGGFSVYGLGILLTLEDKVSDKIGGVSNSLQNLSTKAMSLNYMGKSLMNTGKALLTPVVGLSKEVVRVSSDAEKARITLGALYGSAEAGAKKYNEIVEYAAKTPFEINELRDASLQFKTLGVELVGTGSEVTSTSGKTRQFMEILGDMGAGLSGVARNGFKDVTYAVREFVTEGNKLSFLRRLGVDIDAVLTKAGKTVGNTVEERLKNMADLAEILHFYDPATGEGLTSKMFGTWSQVISNMDDLWTMFCLGIGDTAVGIFENDEFGNTVFAGFKRTLDKVQQVLTKMNLGSFGEAIGKGLYSIMQPLDVIASKLVDVVGFVIDLVSQHPNIAKYALLLPTIAGALFLISGAALVAKSSMMVFGYGLGVVISMIPKALLLAGLFAVIKTAWTKDIGGIRTRLTGFVNTVNTSFSKAKEILALSTDDMIKSYNDLVEQYSKTGDFGAGLTAGIIRTAKLWGAFVDFWNDSTLSQENLKILNEMGLMPVFEKIATWTEKFKAFFKGVTEGFSEMANAVGDFVNSIMTKFFPALETGNGQGLFDSITGKFNGGDMSDIQNMGKNAMKLLPTVLGLIKIAKIIRKHNRSGGTGGGIAGLLSRILGGRNTDTPDGGAGGGILGSLRRIGGTLASLNPVQILKGLGNLSIILIGLGALTMVIGGIASISPATFVKGALAIAALGLVLMPISSPTFDTALNSISRLSRFKYTTFLKGIKNLSVIFGAMSLMTMVIGGIVGISPAAFIAGGIAVTAMGFMFSAIGNPVFMRSITRLQEIAKIKTMDIVKGMANLGIIFGAMTALFMILGAVAMIPFNIGRVAGIALVLGELGLIGMALSYFAGIASGMQVKDVAVGVANMAIALGAMSAVFGLLAWISTFNFDVGRVSSIVDVLMELGKVGTALTLLSGVIGAVEIATGGIAVGAIAAGLATIGVVLVAMSGIMWLVNKITGNLDVGRLDTVMTAILKVGAIGTALSVLAGISGVMLAPAILGLLTIGIVVEGIAALATQFAKLEAKADKIQSGLNVMATIGQGIGKAIGSFIGGIGEGVSNSLPVIGENISSFIASISTVPVPSEGQQSIGDFLSSLGEGLLKITAGNILSAFTGGNSLSKIGEELNGFATSAKTAFDTFDAYPDSGIEKAPKIIESIKGIGAYSFKTGGLAQLFTGEVGLANIGSELSSFSTSAKTAFDNFAEFSDKGIEKLPKIFEAMKGIGDYDFKTGGLAQLITGGTDIGKIGSQLRSFSNSAKTAFDTFAEFSDNGIAKLPRIFEAMKGLSNYDFKSGGLAQLITGGTDISKLGKKLDKFAHSAQSAFNCFSEYPSDGISKLPRIFSAIRNIGEINVASYDSLPDVGKKLDSFAHNAQSAFNCFSEFTAEGFSNVTTMTNVLQNLSTVLNGSFIPSVDTVSSSLSTLSSTLVIVSADFTLLYTSSIMAGTGVLIAGNMIVSGMAMIVSVSTAGVVSIILSFTLLGQGVLNSALVVTAGMMLMYTGVQSGCNLIIVAIASMCATVRSQLASLASSGYSYGSQLSSSIAAGISANSGAIRAAVQSAISSAVASATINIPSVKVGHNALGTSNWAGGLTEINERGGEIVDLPRGTRIYPHDDSVTMAFDEGMRTAIDSMRGNSNDNRQYDNSVYFSAGSIVVQVASASEAEAERFAELVMKKIEKKKRRKAIATYAY